MIDPVPDEYYERYRKLSHQQLYQMLRAGSPAQIEAVANTWKSIVELAGGLAATLRGDLDRLALSWSGIASRAYSDRLGEVATFAQRLADDSDAIRTGLLTMAAALRETQRLAEQPEVAASTLAARLESDGGLASALGYLMTPEASADAHERMVLLVAGLAAHYGVVDHGTWPAAIAPAPEELLGTVTSLAGATLTHAPGTGLLGAEAGSMHGAVIPTGAGVAVPTVGIGTAGPVTSLTGVATAHGPSGTSAVAGGGGRDGGRTGGAGAFSAPPAGMVAPAMGGRPAEAHAGGGTGTNPHAAADNLDWYTNDQMSWSGGQTEDTPPAVLG